MGITKRVLNVSKISEKYDILSIQEKQQAHRVNKTKINLKLSPWQREIDPQRLKAATMRTNKHI